MKKKLVVGDNIVSGRGTWSFGNKVPDTFNSHVEKSIIGYSEGHDIICRLNDFFCPSNGVIVDIGISTGALIKKLLKHNSHKKSLKYFGIDVEKKMIDKAKSELGKVKNLKLISKDIVLYDIPKNDFLVSYYTIQFISPKFRQDVFDKIYNSLNWGGAFIIFEKVRGPDARFQDIISNMYNNYKKDKVNCKKVITIYDLIHEIFHNDYKKNKYFRPKKDILEKVDNIICISNSTKNDLIKYYEIDEKKIKVIYLGNDIKKVENNSSIFSKYLKLPYILFVGKRSGYKNFENLLK